MKSFPFIYFFYHHIYMMIYKLNVYILDREDVLTCGLIFKYL